METLSVVGARRLALARAGLLDPKRTGLPSAAKGKGKRARAAALAIIDRFGYLQLDTVSIAGARSHTIVLLSRLRGFDPALGEQLLQPDEPLFEYWGHEASWLPIDLYPAFEFRRRAFRTHPWWGDIVRENPRVARKLRRQIRDEGPLRSIDMEGRGSRGWWDLKIAKKVATALWSSGELAIRERINFQRAYDLAERVIPEPARSRRMNRAEALRVLLLRAAAGHGWATTGTLAQTWRLRNMRKPITAALAELVEDGRLTPCKLAAETGKPTAGWIRPEDLELASKLERIRPRADAGVVLSPFDPVLWDRARVARLFGFEQILEIFKPASKRIYGYYCMPVLAGDRLVARFDFKADRATGRLNVLSLQFEHEGRAPARDRNAAQSAVERYAQALELAIR